MSIRTPMSRRRPNLPHCPVQAVVAGLVFALAAAAPAGPARADDVADQILAAAKRIPVDDALRRGCAQLPLLAGQLDLPALLSGKPQEDAGSSGLPPGARGAYLGYSAPGQPPIPFVQALLDAGAASKVTLRWTRRVFERDTAYQQDTYVVLGPDREFFPREQALGFVLPPAADPAAAHPGAASAPAFWTTGHFCAHFVPDRVLELEDVRQIGNGFSQVSAAVLFRAELPAWITDPRVVETLVPDIRPWAVRLPVFRNDGGGWRYLPGAVGSLESMTRIVPENRP